MSDKARPLADIDRDLLHLTSIKADAEVAMRAAQVEVNRHHSVVTLTQRRLNEVLEERILATSTCPDSPAALLD